MNTCLDHATTSPIHSEMQDVLLIELGRTSNPSSQYRAGQRARYHLEEAWGEPTAALGAHPGEMVFTLGDSEVDSIAILGPLVARLERPRSLISTVEHPIVQEARGRGTEVFTVNSRGVIENTTQEAADEGVAVISVVGVNSEAEVIYPLDDLIATSSGMGVWGHSDAVQALGYVSLGFHATGLDLMNASAHKVGGPAGTGAPAVRRGVIPVPIGLGDGRKSRIRFDTLLVALAASFVAAAAAAAAGLETKSEQSVTLRDGTCEVTSTCRRRISGENCVLHVVNAASPGIWAQGLLLLLDAEGIHASVGSACRVGVHQPSEVLLTMDAPEDKAMLAVRFSLDHTSGRKDIGRLREVLSVVVERARAAGQNFSAADPEKGGELKVLAAMSGEVDSAVMAARLIAIGHDVTGIHLALNHDLQPYREGSRGCCSLEDAHDTRRTAGLLDIPFYVWDFSGQFQAEVADDFIAEYRASRTPDPCLRCNEKVKFTAVLERGFTLGFDAVVTGHYARVVDNRSELEPHRAADPDRDQSYVLGMLNQDQLRRFLFPLADTPKPQMRTRTHSLGLRIADKPNSYDIRFIPDGDIQDYLGAYLDETPGPTVDCSGTELG